MAEYATYRGRGGGLHRFKLPLSPAFAEQLAKGYLVRVDEAPSPARKLAMPIVIGYDDKSIEKIQEVRDALDSLKVKPIDVELTRPHQVDAKAKWVAYAVAQGMAEADAKAMSKAKLVERFGH